MGIEAKGVFAAYGERMVLNGLELGGNAGHGDGAGRA